MVNVLLVEDHHEVREVMKQFVETIGHKIVGAARSLAEAKVFLDFPGPTVDLLLTDIRLGDGSGLDLAKEVWTTRPEIAIVLMTGYSFPGEAPCPWTILQKPFSSSDLSWAFKKELSLAC